MEALRGRCVRVFVCTLCESIRASLCGVDTVGRRRVQAVFGGRSWGPWDSRGRGRRGRGLLRVRVLQREVVDKRSASTHRQGQRSTPEQEESVRVCWEPAGCSVRCFVKIRDKCFLDFLD